jgi:hypothetical protein
MSASTNENYIPYEAYETLIIEVKLIDKDIRWGIIKQDITLLKDYYLKYKTSLKNESKIYNIEKLLYYNETLEEHIVKLLEYVEKIDLLIRLNIQGNITGGMGIAARALNRIYNLIPNNIMKLIIDCIDRINNIQIPHYENNIPEDKKKEKWKQDIQIEMVEQAVIVSIINMRELLDQMFIIKMDKKLDELKGNNSQENFPSNTKKEEHNLPSDIIHQYLELKKIINNDNNVYLFNENDELIKYLNDRLNIIRSLIKDMKNLYKSIQEKYSHREQHHQTYQVVTIKNSGGRKLHKSKTPIKSSQKPKPKITSKQTAKPNYKTPPKKPSTQTMKPKPKTSPKHNPKTSPKPKPKTPAKAKPKTPSKPPSKTSPKLKPKTTPQPKPRIAKKK